MIDFEAKPLRRREDGRLLTGTGRYTADLALSDTLHVAFVRSHHAHATIRGIDTSEARSMPGVAAVLTAADLAGVRPIPGGIGFPRPDGSPAPKTDRAILASDRVRFVGEPVAAVLARSRSDAQDAAEAVMVDYDSQPAVIDPLQALEAGAPQVWDIAPGNVAYLWKGGSQENADANLARAAHVTRLSFGVSRVTANSMEPRNALARVAPDGRLEVTASHQGPHGLRNALADVLGETHRPGARGDP